MISEIKADLEKQEKNKRNSIGRCALCGEYILKPAVKDVAYIVWYNKRMHKICKENAPKQDIIALRKNERRRF